jgi:23S rRNA pseudouridine1911/1915/1917 synthase
VQLGFHHPATGEWVQYTSEYPDDLATALHRIAEGA